MRLKVQITEYKGGKKSFLVFDDVHEENSDICGKGWALCDAIADFIEQYNRSEFFDDDTPVVLRPEDIELKKIKILVRKV